MRQPLARVARVGVHIAHVLLACSVFHAGTLGSAHTQAQRPERRRVAAGAPALAARLNKLMAC